MKRYLLPFISAALCATPLSFDEALSSILSRSTIVDTAKANKEGVEAKNWASNYSLFPNVSLNAQETRSRALDLSENSQSRFYGVTANLNLFHFGSDVAAMAAAKHENEAQTYLVDNAILKAEEDGTRAIFSVIEAEATVKGFERNLTTRKEALEIGNERFRRGLLASQEVDKLLIDHDNAEAQLNDAEGELRRAKASLFALLEDDSVESLWPWKSIMGKMAVRFKEISDPRFSQRPDWKQAELNLTAAHARKRQALGQALPSLDFAIKYGFADYRKPEESKRSGEEWTGTLTLTIPLFDKFATYGSYRAALHAAHGAEIERERVRRTAKAEWNASKDTFLIAFKGAEAREKTLIVTRKLFDVNTARFHRGLINANELRIDQDRLTQAEMNAVKGWSSAHLRLLKTCHALGERLKSCFGVE